MSEETGKTRMVHIDQLIECKQINEPQQEETQAPKEKKEKKTQTPKKKKEKKTQTPKKKKGKKTGTQARNDNNYAIRTRSATQAARTHTSTQPAQVMTSSRKDEYADAIKGVREFFRRSKQKLQQNSWVIKKVTNKSKIVPSQNAPTPNLKTTNRGKQPSENRSARKGRIFFPRHNQSRKDPELLELQF